MGKILVASLFIRSETDPILAPLARDEHTFHIVDPLQVRSEPELVRALDGVVATLASIEPYTDDVLAAAPALRVISRTGVGYDAIDVAAATRRGIAVCTTPNTNQHSVADLAVALILTSLRNIVEGDRIVRAGQWIQPLGRELRGLTVGVVGTGLIGREVIKRLAGFEPRLVAYDVVQSPEVIERYAVRYLSLDELLANSDVVTLHAPLLPETRGVIGERALALIKPTAYLVNTARGPLIDERALAAALASGRLAGAALDVFEVEPLPADSPLRSVQHLIMTPHIAGGTEQSRLAMAKMAVENAARILRGEPPLSCLNPEVLNRTLAGA